MNKSIQRFLFLLLIFIDITGSFFNHYSKSLDGDIASVVLRYHEVMSDPFGVGVLLENKVYGGTNRFFAHWMMSEYFKNVPIALQYFFNPIDSVYISCALAKTLIQVLILWVLASIISGTRNILNTKFLLSAILITPLFQTEGYSRYMGVINSSITYAFFYSLPVALVLLFFLPFHKRIQNGKWVNFSIAKIIFLMLLSFVLTLGGPLSPAIILIGCSLILFSIFKKHFVQNASLSFLQNSVSSFKKIQKQLVFLFFFICLLSLYSLYIGQYNSESFFSSIPLLQRYAQLPIGLYYPFTQKLGLPLLLFMILLNLFLIFKYYNNQDSKIIFVHVKWVTIFVCIYILLLPLGGFREYRPNIIRGDTLLPVIVCMIYLYGISTFYLLNQALSNFQRVYTGAVVIFLLIFGIANKSVSKENECEKDALKKIASSGEKIVLIEGNCMVMSWQKMNDYNDSKLNSQLLKHWRVIKDDKLYYQK